MTAVAFPVTGVSAGAERPVPGMPSQQSEEPGFALYVGMPTAGVTGRALLAEIAAVVAELVEQRAPGAVVRTALDLGGRGRGGDVVGRLRSAFEEMATGTPPTATERAHAAWRVPTGGHQVVVDVAAREVTIGGHPVPLTYKEFALLEYLLRSPHRAVAREELLASVWRKDESQIGTRTIDVHVRRLREKLGGFLQIVTVRGVGYRCDPAPEIVLVGSGDAG